MSKVASTAAGRGSASMGAEAVGLFALALSGCVIAAGLVNLRQPTVRLGIAWAAFRRYSRA